MAQAGLLETPLQGPGLALVDLAVDDQREPVLEGHGVEVVTRHLFEEGGQHAGQRHCQRRRFSISGGEC